MFGSSVELRRERWEAVCRQSRLDALAPVSSPQLMESIAAAIISAYMPPPTALPSPEDLIAVVGVGREQRAQYPLRIVTPSFETTAITGDRAMTGYRFCDIVAAAVDAGIKMMDKQQSTGEWRPVAFRLSLGNSRSFTRVSTGATDAEVFNAAGTVVSESQVRANPQYTRAHEIQVSILRAEIAMADLIQGAPVDNWLNRTGKSGSSIEQYAKSGLLSHLPAWWRKEREHAIEVICDHYGIATNTAVNLGLDEAQMRKFAILDALPEVDDEDLALRFGLTQAGVEEARRQLAEE